jgi:GntR family transcriptional regulator, transcriptional repressor for pyruvate dehydrogenase complex
MGQRGRRAALDIRPVARTRAHEEVVRQLQSLMRSGALRPGDRLPAERELSARFGVSRATIRQALEVLDHNGLIERRIGDGTFAADASAASVTSLVTALRLAQGSLTDQLELRELVEPQVARLAARRASAGDVAILRQCVARQEQCMARGVPFVDDDSAFHLAIARAASNDLLTKMVEGIHELLRASRERSLHAPGGMRRSLDGHLRILETIDRHDDRGAYEAMHAHLLDVRRLILELPDGG